MFETMQMLRELEVSEFESETKQSRVLPETLRALERLSWNYWWSWAADGASVFRDLDAETWEECEHIPCSFWREVREYRCLKMGPDPPYTGRHLGQTILA